MDFDPSLPAIDWSALADMHEMEADAELIGLFLEEAPSQVAMLQTALTTQDSDKLRAVAHSLKSTSSYIGAKNVSLLSAELEKRGREKSWDGVDTLMQQLNTELARAVVELQKGYPSE